MVDFVKLAQAVAETQAINTSEKITQLKERKDSVTQMMDIAISQEELKKNEQDAERNRIKSEQKRAKIKADLLKSAIESQAQGPVAIGGNLLNQFGPEVQPDAADLPMIDANRVV